MMHSTMAKASSVISGSGTACGTLGSTGQWQSRGPERPPKLLWKAASDIGTIRILPYLARLRARNHGKSLEMK